MKIHREKKDISSVYFDPGISASSKIMPDVLKFD